MFPEATTPSGGITCRRFSTKSATSNSGWREYLFLLEVDSPDLKCLQYVPIVGSQLQYGSLFIAGAHLLKRKSTLVSLPPTPLHRMIMGNCARFLR